MTIDSDSDYDFGEDFLEWRNARNGGVPRGAEKMAFPSRRGSKRGIYLVRAEHNGDIYPGTFLPKEGVVQIAVGNDVIYKSNYQVIH